MESYQTLIIYLDIFNLWLAGISPGLLAASIILYLPRHGGGGGGGGGAGNTTVLFLSHACYVLNTKKHWKVTGNSSQG
jgi:hypothetical protein